jgi:hypothetical protein
MYRVARLHAEYVKLFENKVLVYCVLPVKFHFPPKFNFPFLAFTLIFRGKQKLTAKDADAPHRITRFFGYFFYSLCGWSVTGSIDTWAAVVAPTNR